MTMLKLYYGTSILLSERPSEPTQVLVINHSLLPPDVETLASSRPPTRQPQNQGVHESLTRLTKEELKQQELAVSW